MITKDHRDFAIELVRLCRKHGVGRIKASFDMGSSSRYLEERADWTNVGLNWNEGCHGTQGKIKIELTCTQTLKEEVKDEDINE